MTTTERTAAPVPIDDPLLGLREVGAALGLNKSTVWKLTQDGRLPTVDLGIRRVLVRRSDLEKYIAGLPEMRPTKRTRP